jgi:hypothetical protein
VGCNFDVVDAVKKLEKLGIVSRVSSLQNHRTKTTQKNRRNSTIIKKLQSLSS